MGLWRSLTGMIRVQITSASLSKTLSKINDLGIILQEVTYIDELTIEASINRYDYRCIKSYADRQGETIRVIKKYGVYWAVKRIIKRPLLLVGIGIYTVLALYLPTRVLFVQVEGNSTVETKMIIEKAEKCGIIFGASRREVRSERVKNALLGEIPELQWAGVNTYGCVAVISVKERSAVEKASQPQGISSIVAIRDGVISELVVAQGSALCKVGQAVKAGEVLVSGYTDCGIIVRATRAQGEIYAQTLRELTVVSPSVYRIRVSEIAQKEKYSVLIGKKLINLSQDSGISTAECVKMIEIRKLTLPGGFQLPIALVIERYVHSDCQDAEMREADIQIRMQEFSKEYLESQMVAGKVDNKAEVNAAKEGSYYLYGRYACHEMIGQERIEEIINRYGENN